MSIKYTLKYINSKGTQITRVGEAESIRSGHDYIKIYPLSSSVSEILTLEPPEYTYPSKQVMSLVVGNRKIYPTGA